MADVRIAKPSIREDNSSSIWSSQLSIGIEGTNFDRDPAQNDVTCRARCPSSAATADDSELLVGLVGRARNLSIAPSGQGYDNLTYDFYSRVTRKSIDALKEFFKEDVGKDDWQLLVRLKKMYGVI